MMSGLIQPLDERFQSYLHDESGLLGAAATISFPRSAADVAAVVAATRRAGTPVTVQGGRTGLVGGAVPTGGHLMSLGRMTGIERPHRCDDGSWAVTVEPGVTLAELRRALAAARVGQRLFWPPDPTETTATVGGVVSCGARGLTALRYGSTREHVAALRLVTAEGAEHEIVRGAGSLLPGCDLAPLDLVAGGEGTFGVISGLTLRLSPRPAAVWGLCFFFAQRESLGVFADRLVALAPGRGAAGVAAMEYVDRRALTLVAERQALGAAAGLPAFPAGTLAAILVELHGDGDDELAELAGRLLDVAAACGADPDSAWALIGEAEAERLRALRHAAAETANLQGELVRRADPSLVRIGTDMSLPGLTFADALEFYESGLRDEGLDACLCGHLGDNRLIVTVLPRTAEEHVRGCRLIEQWAGRAVALGGRPVNEHGVGKLRKHLIAARASASPWRERRACKAALDPQGFWGPGTVF